MVGRVRGGWCVSDNRNLGPVIENNWIIDNQAVTGGGVLIAGAVRLRGNRIASPRSLSAEEHQAVIQVLHEPRFVDLCCRSRRSAGFWTLAGEGSCGGTIAAMAALSCELSLASAIALPFDCQDLGVSA